MQLCQSQKTVVGSCSVNNTGQTSEIMILIQFSYVKRSVIFRLFIVHSFQF